MKVLAGTITSFKGSYSFLSNFSDAVVLLDDDRYSTVEHAYQAAKTLDREARYPFKLESASPVSRSAAAAKRRGQKLRLRDDWEEVKLEVMEYLLRQKFAPGTTLAAELLRTSPHMLVEGNTWNDRYWGAVCVGDSSQVECEWVGDNHLGRLLMAIRNELGEGQ